MGKDPCFRVESLPRWSPNIWKPRTLHALRDCTMTKDVLARGNILEHVSDGDQASTMEWFEATASAMTPAVLPPKWHPPVGEGIKINVDGRMGRYLPHRELQQ
ncbi:hypothetical protein V6N11_005725 [Hibiscus sabdariffa]|uniref:Uncharacterized protein n=1 Tax=Hibiscus sabdariffa TaxID=183260 RepID=A0ABR2RP49_9ROSI